MSDFFRPVQPKSTDAMKGSDISANRPRFGIGAGAQTGKTGCTDRSFADVLQAAQANNKPLVLSQHASARLQARGITATPQIMSQLTKATDLLASKNARESLVVVNQVGFVVNVPSRTVVTAMALQGGEPQVFTNIDSAVWL